MKVNILGKQYSLKYTADDNVLNSSLRGELKPTTFEIYISTKQPKQGIDSTVIHECLHAIDIGLDLDWSEHTTRQVETAFYQFIVDNKKLISSM